MAEEKQVEEVKEKETKKESWWSSLPTRTKVYAIGILVFIVWVIKNQGTDFGQTFWIIAIIVLILYIMGRDIQSERDFYTSKEAMMLIEDHCGWLKRRGTIEQHTQVFVGPRINLWKTRATGQEYFMEVILRSPDGLVEPAMGILNFKVPGIPRLVGANGRIWGDELPHIKVIEPSELKYSKQYGSAFSKLFGG